MFRVKSFAKMIFLALTINEGMYAYEIAIENDKTKNLGYGEWVVKTDGEFDLMQMIIQPGDTVFDVGAFVGEWSLLALQMNRPMQLYVFEPLPTVFPDLRLRLSNCPNVQVFNLAFSNNRGKANFYHYDETYQFSGLSSFYERQVLKADHQPPKIIEIQQDTISHFCKDHAIDKIDFLKIDAEGAEWVILQGASDLVREGKIKAIQFEYGGCYLDANSTLEDIFHFFTSSGYVLFRIVPNGLIQISEWSQHLENYVISNYVAVKEPEILSRFGEIAGQQILHNLHF